MSVFIIRMVAIFVCWALVLRAAHEVTGSWTVATGVWAAIWLVTNALTVQRRP